MKVNYLRNRFTNTEDESYLLELQLYDSGRLGV